jgi:hypothetical protein
MQDFNMEKPLRQREKKSRALVNETLLCGVCLQMPWIIL